MSDGPLSMEARAATFRKARVVELRRAAFEVWREVAAWADMGTFADPEETAVVRAIDAAHADAFRRWRETVLVLAEAEADG